MRPDICDYCDSPQGWISQVGMCRGCFERRRKESVARQRARRDPAEARARGAVRRAVLAGKLVRPEVCDECGVRPHSYLKIEAHHYKGYAREHWLDVEWLCRGCHASDHTATGYLRIDRMDLAPFEEGAHGN